MRSGGRRPVVRLCCGAPPAPWPQWLFELLFAALRAAARIASEVAGTDVQVLERLARRVIHTRRRPAERGAVLGGLSPRRGNSQRQDRRAIRHRRADRRRDAGRTARATSAKDDRQRHQDRCNDTGERCGGMAAIKRAAVQESDGQHDPAAAPSRCTKRFRRWPPGTRSRASSAAGASPGYTTCHATVLRKAIARLRAKMNAAPKRTEPVMQRAVRRPMCRKSSRRRPTRARLETANLPAAADAVRDLFAAAGEYYGWVSRRSRRSRATAACRNRALSVNAVVNEVHRFRRPSSLLRAASAASVPCATGWPNISR